MNRILLSFFATVLAIGASAQANLLENGDFETWTDDKPANWSTTSKAGNATITQSTTAHGGSYSAQVATASSNKRIAYKETTLAAGTYSFSIWIRTADGSSDGKVCIGYVPVTDGTAGTYQYLPDSNGEAVSGEWTQYTHEFTLDAETTICPLVMVKKKTVDVLVDDASLTISGGGTTSGIANTPETAYSVAKGIELINAGEDLDTKVYVKGYITSITEVSTSYGNATYKISDAKGDETTTITVFRGYYLNEEKFASEDQIAVGDEVIVYGKLVDYNGTMEISSGNNIYSHNGKTTTGGTTVDIANTPETAYSVAKGIELINAGEGLSTAVYVKGYITSITEVSTSYGNATYKISDTKGDETTTITVFRGYYLNGEKFTSEDQIAVGDEVVVYGKLVDYNGTMEISSGNNIYSQNGKTTTGGTTVDIANTPENAYSVAKGIELINAGEGLSTAVYVKGYITSITEVSTSYGNATYNISDTKGDETTTITVFRGYYLGGEKFTSEDQIAVGDEVVVYGKLVNYNGTMEITSGNNLYSINGTTGISVVKSNAISADAPIYNLAGQRLQKLQKGINIVGGKKVVVKK